MNKKSLSRVFVVFIFIILGAIAIYWGGKMPSCQIKYYELSNGDVCFKKTMPFDNVYFKNCKSDPEIVYINIENYKTVRDCDEPLW